MTPERLQRINQMLDKRQIDLTLCLEMVHKTQNLAAILRTADAVGVSKLHAVWPDPKMWVSGHTASGSQQWVDVHKHASTKEAIEHLRGQGMQILATNLSDRAVDYREIDYTKPTAILMGQEKFGISEEALTMADQDIIIPMEGMVQSLNVSVASALILYEAQRQRQLAGLYDTRKIDEATCQRILFEGGHPLFAKACKRKGLPYPHVDQDGQIQASDEWWAKMQMTQEAWEHLDDDEPQQV
ncbi:tRNA (guanosine(18)-2'-O)-methyltransferase TrmH [Paraferrimonas sedimenticola]|uniref:tRNA (guanosine(18)-2'-O)-methyltransferase n=1 Tax=Paraferrimonas sedimenticola TaxID=375674 RepID=A0AA37RSZ6_9GAMM|nr:tRNA (guanosine(18)-2'-O)-methyltransferase TrmH [Paraferrimonas sedimenticola]GLP95378.1 tRNA (guanosine(18)-2'-O)-methyltransferase [Paraferrimonas sedimenticola]